MTAIELERLSALARYMRARDPLSFKCSRVFIWELTDDFSFELRPNLFVLFLDPLRFIEGPSPPLY